MNIKKALAKKNKLVGEMTEEFNKANSYNSIVVGNTRHYNIKECLDKWFSLSAELVELKTKIHKANTPVFGKIFLLSELKNQIKLLKGFNCTEGIDNNPYRGRGDSSVVMDVEINTIFKDELIKKLETRIENLQEELDEFNYNTEI